MKEIRLIGTTSALGAATVTATAASFGRVYAVEWVDGSLVDGVDAVLKCTRTPSGVDNTLLTLTDANADAWHYVRAVSSNATGGAGALEVCPVANGVLTLTIADGGDSKVGGCIVYLED